MRIKLTSMRVVHYIMIFPNSHKQDYRQSSIFWDIPLRSRWKLTDVSEERVASNFRVEE
jgi:hypothetical protein